MNEKPLTVLATMIGVAAGSGAPLHQQIYAGLRRLVLAGTLPPGSRLPSTRTLADQLGVSRMTVVQAFDQLAAEGYIEGQVGAGTYVARLLPDDLLSVEADTKTAPPTSGERRLSRRGALLARTNVSTAPDIGRPRAFRPGLPALDAFPFATWRKLAVARYHNPPRELLAYGDPAGYAPLRAAITAYLGVSRGVKCAPEQVIVVAGSQQALDLTARLLLDPGDRVLVEDPGYMGARGALQAAGATVAPVTVDGEGLDVAAGERLCPDARLAYVTPSHQYPLGVVMSLARRLALLDWAQRNDAWVIEDDYDSEYRYAGRPLAALQGLDGQQRVIYVGTFSKVMFPGLRLGYLVVPPDLVDAFLAARSLADRHPPALEQAVLADFMAGGHFTRHVRRMRQLYAERRETLVACARAELSGLLELQPCETGLHLVGRLPDGSDDKLAARQAQAQAVDAPALSAYALKASPYPGLVLGYTGVDGVEIARGVQGLARALA